MGRGSSKAGRSSGGGGKITTLPALKGTEKQVEWAEKIRESYIAPFNLFTEKGYVQKSSKEFAETDGVKINDSSWGEHVLSGVAGKTPGERYDEWRESGEYKDFKSKRDTMTKDQRNEFLRNKKKKFRNDFMNDARKKLTTETDAGWWINKRPR